MKPAGKATIWTIAGDDPKAFNTVNEARVAVKKQSEIGFDGTLKAAPYSVTLIRLPMREE